MSLKIGWNSRAWIGNITNVGAEARSRLVLASKIEEAVREADLIVEAVAEEMEMKIEMFIIFDKFAKPKRRLREQLVFTFDCGVGAVTFCRSVALACAFLSRAGEEDALELVSTPQTSEETVSRCRRLAGGWAKRS